MNISFIRQVGWLPFLRRFVWRQLNKRILRRGVAIRLPTGLLLHAPLWSPSASEVVYTNADVDWGSEKLFIDNLDHDGAFIDVGAHVGYYSLYVAPCVNKVYAFEPDVQSFTALVRNLSQCAYAESVNKAVYSTSGEMTVNSRANWAGFVHLADDTATVGTDERLIDVVSIDEWMSARPNEQVSGIKIDIDGLDFEVLKGAEEVMRRDQPLVLTEFSPNETNDLSDLKLHLNNLGYAAFAFLKSKDNLFSMHRFSFNQADHQHFKMIFLVPQRLIESFTDQCD